MAFRPAFSTSCAADLAGRNGRPQGAADPQAAANSPGSARSTTRRPPSFYVVEDKGFFHCFGCGAHGDAIGFVMRADNLDFHRGGRAAGRRGRAARCRSRPPQERERAQRQKTLLEALEPRRLVLREAAVARRPARRARDYLQRPRPRRGDHPPFPARLGAGRPAAPEAARCSRGLPEALLIEAGLLRQPRGRRRRLRLFPRPGHVPDRRPRRPGHRLRRPHARRGAAEIPQLARRRRCSRRAGSSTAGPRRAPSAGDATAGRR